MRRVLTLMAALALAEFPAASGAAPRLEIVAAENFYGDIARQLASPDTTVTSILSSPDEDPHLFEASPSVARALSGARIVISNGASYDPWMNKLLRVGKSPGRQAIDVGELLHTKPGANPHLWYDPANMAVAARAVTAALMAADPTGAADDQRRLQAFTESLSSLQSRMDAIRARYAGQSITATEPVFGLMAQALGLKMRNERFQLSVMNGTEPRASDVVAFDADLRRRAVRVLIVNKQARDPTAQRLLGIAKAAGVPVVEVTETMPAGQTYQSWMSGQLSALEAALAQP